MRFPKCLTGALFAIAATGALANPEGILFLGTDASASTDDVAFVLFNQPVGDSGEVPSLVTNIRPASGAAGKNAKNHRLAVVAPGTYRIAIKCVTTMRETTIRARHEFSAGMTYTLRCGGQTPRTLKLAVDERKTTP